MDLSFSSMSKEDNVDIADSIVDVHNSLRDGEVVVDKSESSGASSTPSSITSTVVVWSASPILIDLSFSSTSKEDSVDIVDSIVDVQYS